jgi:Na+-translocating ferredoxin:NAD+ oxidoreductase RnfA subunit
LAYGLQNAPGMLIHVVLVLIVAGLALWLIESFIPMDAKVLRLLQAVVIIVLIVWLLRVFGIIDIFPGMRL